MGGLSNDPAAPAQPTEEITPRIAVVRGCRLILDADLAARYGVQTEALAARQDAFSRETRAPLAQVFDALRARVTPPTPPTPPPAPDRLRHAPRRRSQVKPSML